MPGVDRRDFLSTIVKSAGVAVGASLFDISLLRSVSAKPVDGKIDVIAGEHLELATTGGAVVLNVEEVADVGGKIILVRTGESTFVAVAAKCTHKGCTIGYDADAKHFECPCHGSQYNLDGTVAHGPTTKPVTSYATSYANGVVTITLGANTAPADSTKK